MQDIITKLLSENNTVKCFTFEKIIKHLSKACNDPRSREQKRAKIALKSITRFVREVKEEINDNAYIYLDIR